ncbi:hypothetical protein PybrP1_000900 [[Pythium] brassicae (nom. inval.)]|nr:hypothetical protein PybrP1_000900 [[Pythium] brassicae (nom. inval.)]
MLEQQTALDASAGFAMDKETWLRRQEQERHERIVAVNEPMRITPSLYFGTRRCTYSDVVSVATTVRRIPRLSSHHWPHHQSSPTHSSTTSAVATAASGAATDKGSGASASTKPTRPWSGAAASALTDAARSQLPEFPFALGELPAYIDSPLGGDRDRKRRITAWKASALSAEQQLFMTRLQQMRRARFELEQRAALVIQRVHRGRVLRRRFLEIRTKLQVRKRVRVSLVKVTRGTAIIAGEKDRRARVLAAQHAAVSTLQRAFRGWCARKFAAKERALRVQERLQQSATRLQHTWRACVARVSAQKARARMAEQRQRALAVLVTRLFRGYEARQRVRRLVSRQRWLAAQRLQWALQRHHAEKARRLQHRRRREEQRHCAAIQVQRLLRGRLSRALVTRLRAAEERAIRAACALAIQRVYRGCVGRLRARFQRAFRAHERAWRCALHATRLVRGFLARRAMATERVLQETDVLVQTRRGNVSTVIDLLDGFGTVDDQPADVTVASPGSGNTILHFAAKRGLSAIVTHVVPKLLTGSTPGMIHALNSRGESPLQLAIAHGHEQIAGYLLATTAPLFEQSATRSSERSLLLLAARSGMGAIAASLVLLFPHRFTGSECDSWTKRTVLHEALLLLTSARCEASSLAVERDERIVATMTTLLTKLPQVKIDAQDFVGFTALHLAAQLGNLRAVQLLLEYGADVTVADAQGRTAWRIALLQAHEPCFLEIRRQWLDSVTSASATAGGGAALVAQGSSQELADRDGSSTALVNAAVWSVNSTGQQPQQLHPQLEQYAVDACRAGDTARVRCLVEEFNVSINATDKTGDRDSLLLIACRADNVGLVRYLVQRDGAGELLAVDYVNVAGESALESALNSPATLCLLLGGCKLASPCRPVGAKQRSVCHEAVRRGHDVRSWLNDSVVVAPSVLVTIADDDGRSLLHDAAAFGHLHSAKTLVNIGVSAAQQSRSDKRTPLHEACRTGAAALVARMLQQRHSDSAAAVEIHDAEGRSPFFDAVVSDSVACLELLLHCSVGRTVDRSSDEVADAREEILSRQVDANGCGLLHEAIVSMAMEENEEQGSQTRSGGAVFEFLVASSPATLEQQQPPRMLSPLHIALRDADGLLPVHHAAKRGHVSVIEAFAVSGFDCTEVDAATGNTLLHFAVLGACFESERSDASWSAYGVQPSGGSAATVATLEVLAPRGSAVKAFNARGLQPLHLVAMSPSSRVQEALEAARVLVKHHAPADAGSKAAGAATPIQLARQHGNNAIADFLASVQGSDAS